LGFDGKLLGAVVRKFADAVFAFYRRKLAQEDGVLGQSGAGRAADVVESPA